MKRAQIIFAAIGVFFCGSLARAQAGGQLLVPTGGDGDQIFHFPTPGLNLPTPFQQVVGGLPAPPREPSAVSCFGSERCLVGNGSRNQVLVVDLVFATIADIIPTPTFAGSGTIAVAPNHAYALAGYRAVLTVIKAPFTAGSALATVALPGELKGSQSQGIVFDDHNRAFVFSQGGISVLDPPYSAIAFTMPVANTFLGGALALSPDGKTLLATKLTGSSLDIFTAPFSAASVPTQLTINTSNRLAGIAITPDGSAALVTAYGSAQVFLVAAPFGPSSVVDELVLPAPLVGERFEHVEFNPAGTLAVLGGGSEHGGPLALVEGPFTVGATTVHEIAIAGGRGSGGASFLPNRLFADGFESGDASAWSQALP